MNLKKKVTFIVLSILFISLAFNLLNQDLWDQNEKLLKKEIISLEPTVQTINLLDVTPFEWDVVYSFGPYTPKEKVYETVGYRWDNIRETVSEGMNQIVFLNNEKVVCYVYGYPDHNGYGIYLSGEEVNEFSQRLASHHSITFQVKRNDKFVYLITE